MLPRMRFLGNVFSKENVVYVEKLSRPLEAASTTQHAAPEASGLSRKTKTKNEQRERIRKNVVSVSAFPRLCCSISNYNNGSFILQ